MAVVAGVALLTGLAVVACDDSTSNPGATSGSGAVMTDAEFCSTITTEISKIMSGQPVQDALNALQTSGKDSCGVTGVDNAFTTAIKSSKQFTTGPPGSRGSEAMLPNGFEETLRAHLVSVGTGSDADPPLVDVDNYWRHITVIVSRDVDPVSGCTAASNFAFGDGAPSGAAHLVTIRQDSGAKVVAQRTRNSTERETSGFVYDDIPHYLRAEHADASWIDRIIGGDYGIKGNGYLYPVIVSHGTSEAEGLETCTQSAAYAYGRPPDPPAGPIEILATSETSGGTIRSSPTPPARMTARRVRPTDQLIGDASGVIGVRLGA